MQLKEAGKDTSIKNFQDSSISTALPIIDLIDAIQPGSISYNQVLPGHSPEVCFNHIFKYISNLVHHLSLNFFYAGISRKLF